MSTIKELSEKLDAVTGELSMEREKKYKTFLPLEHCSDQLKVKSWFPFLITVLYAGVFALVPYQQGFNEI